MRGERERGRERTQSGEGQERYPGAKRAIRKGEKRERTKRTDG